MNFNWRSVLRDLNVVLLTFLLLPVVLVTWLQVTACARASTLSPICLLAQHAPSLLAAPKAKGAR